MKQTLFMLAAVNAFSSFGTTAFMVISKYAAPHQRTTNTHNHNVLMVQNLAASKDDLDEIRMKREDEILAAGGDPSFLTNDNLIEADVEEEEDVDMPSMSLLGMAGVSGVVADIIGDDEGEEEAVKVEAEVVPPFVWDGKYDENAYFDD